MKIAVGLSGGVDSAVAAFILKARGHDLYGVTMKIWAGGKEAEAKGNACYGPGEEVDLRRAEEICAAIEIPHHVFDLSGAYSETVLDYFTREYREGRTPNPCILCNQRMKFGLLPALAVETIGAEAFATGHYARTAIDPETGRVLLLKARDKSKDQSYFLHRLTQDQLRSAIFPLGEYTKEEVREMAAKEGLPSWNDPESQDFYDGDYRDLIGCDDEPGDIVDTKGAVLGRHSGVWNYTVGQRRGLGIAAPEPLYVTSINADRKEVIVATKSDALKKSFRAALFNWVSMNEIKGTLSCTVKPRSAHPGARCVAEPLDESTVGIILEEPEGGIAPGQSAVLFDGDTVIGGGIIELAEA